MSEFPKITPLRLLERLRTRVSPSKQKILSTFDRKCVFLVH